jgi:hypothetical protein
MSQDSVTDAAALPAIMHDPMIVYNTYIDSTHFYDDVNGVGGGSLNEPKARSRGAVGLPIDRSAAFAHLFATQCMALVVDCMQKMCSFRDWYVYEIAHAVK